MKAEIYQWIKTLAIFYILFSAMIHLVPDQKYERYIKFFMGLLLIYILCVPVFSLLGASEKLVENFSLNYQDELEAMESDEAENLQNFYLNKSYCNELKKEIISKCMQNGVNPKDAVVHIEGETTVAEVYLYDDLTHEQERRLKNELAGEFGFGEKDIRILAEGDGQTTMDSSSSAGNSADGNRDTDIKR